MADLYGREDMYAKTVEIAMNMEDNINTLIRHLIEMEAEEKNIHSMMHRQR